MFLCTSLHAQNCAVRNGQKKILLYSSTKTMYSLKPREKRQKLLSSQNKND